jgi:hypothetical protein
MKMLPDLPEFIESHRNPRAQILLGEKEFERR